MGRASTITNKHDGKKYNVSTTRNPYGVWETAVFGRGFLGFPRLTNPLWIANATSEEEANASHDSIVEIVANLPRSDWERSYTLEGRLKKGQGLVRETTPSGSPEKLSWLSMFGGKPNTGEVLSEKADVVAQLAVASAENGRDVLSELCHIPNGGEQAGQVFTEMMMLTVHFADRMAYEFLPEPQHAFFTDCLLKSTLATLAQRNQVQGSTPALEELASNFVETFAARQDEYGSYPIHQEEGEGPKGTLFWEFAKRVAHVVGSDKDALIIVVVENYAVKVMVELNLEELLLGKLN
jgi:hypothetical protein